MRFHDSMFSRHGARLLLGEASDESHPRWRRDQGAEPWHLMSDLLAQNKPCQQACLLQYKYHSIFSMRCQPLSSCVFYGR